MKQELLYESDKYVIYNGKRLNIRFISEYYDMLPRPISLERQLLKEDLMINGLKDEIKINTNGTVLDGHTRVELCEELGWKTRNGDPIKLKFLIKSFETKEEERDYVLTTNLMRRHLNSFQKVRLVYNLYTMNKDNKHVMRQISLYNVLEFLKDKKEPQDTITISKGVGQDKNTVSRLLRILKDDYSVSKSEQVKKYDTARGGHMYYTFSILPKGEEIIFKGRPMKISATMLGKTIGLERNLVSKAFYLMEHANSCVLSRLEAGTTSIMKEWLEATKPLRAKRIHSSHYLKEDTKVICPHCEQVSFKKEWKIA